MTHRARTQATGAEIDADDGASAVLGKLRAVASYPDIVITVAEIVARLASSLSARFSDPDAFVRRYGARLRAAGGDYDRRVPSEHERHIELPGTPEAIAVLDAILAERWAEVDACERRRKWPASSVCTVIARGSVPLEVGNIPAWVTVQYPRSVAAFMMALNRAVGEAIERGILRASWPDPRMREWR